MEKSGGRSPPGRLLLSGAAGMEVQSKFLTVIKCTESQQQDAQIKAHEVKQQNIMVSPNPLGSVKLIGALYYEVPQSVDDIHLEDFNAIAFMPWVSRRVVLGNAGSEFA